MRVNNTFEERKQWSGSRKRARCPTSYPQAIGDHVTIADRHHNPTSTPSLPCGRTIVVQKQCTGRHAHRTLENGSPKQDARLFQVCNLSLNTTPHRPDPVFTHLMTTSPHDGALAMLAHANAACKTVSPCKMSKAGSNHANHGSVINIIAYSVSVPLVRRCPVHRELNFAECPVPLPVVCYRH